MTTKPNSFEEIPFRKKAARMLRNASHFHTDGGGRLAVDEGKYRCAGRLRMSAARKPPLLTTVPATSRFSGTFFAHRPHPQEIRRTVGIHSLDHLRVATGCYRKEPTIGDSRKSLEATESRSTADDCGGVASELV